MKPLTTLALLGFSAAFATAAPLANFSHATFTEVVKEVFVVHTGDASTVPAKMNDPFIAPDLVKTGRKSHAQLTLADGTVVRVGANAVFTFDKDSRTIRLEQGALLFTAPKNAGGGKIVTASATCSVIGTTVILNTSKSGGDVLQVLEGAARFTRKDGTSATVAPAHIAFVPVTPNGAIPVRAIEGLPRNNDLVSDFASPLPSAALIEAALKAAPGAPAAALPYNPSVAEISPNGE